MTTIDVIILIVVILLLGAIIYFNIIRPKLKHQTGCSKCPYCKSCNKTECGSKTLEQYNLEPKETNLETPTPKTPETESKTQESKKQKTTNKTSGGTNGKASNKTTNKTSSKTNKTTK